MDHAILDPDMCTCRKKELAKLVSSWSKRATARIHAVMESGKAINFAAVKREAEMLASLGRGGPAAFAPQNVHYGHFCDGCPYRRKTPFQETLAVDPQPSRG